VIAGIRPQRSVRRATQYEALNVSAVWKVGREQFYESRAEISIEKQIQPVVEAASLRSRAAAN